jgi:hypothetical protein
LEKPLKRVTSIHRTRDAAEVELGEHRKTHGKKIEVCNMRIVWSRKKSKPGMR